MKKDMLLIENGSVKTQGIEINDNIFAAEISEGCIYHAIRNHLANKRVGTVGKKTRSMVHGSKRKPWRQKGTGRARAGTKQSPIWVGGGVALAPQARDYSYTLPRKIKNKAYRSVLTLKNNEEEMSVLKNFTIDSGKTKDLVNFLLPVVKNEKFKKVILIIPSDYNAGNGTKQGKDIKLSVVADKKLRRRYASGLQKASWNIPWLKVMYANQMNLVDIFYSKQLLICESAVEEIVKILGE